MKLLKNQNGTSMTEFLIFAPVVAILIFISHDMNQSIQERTHLSITNRNGLFLKKNTVEFYKQNIQESYNFQNGNQVINSNHQEHQGEIDYINSRLLNAAIATNANATRFGEYETLAKNQNAFTRESYSSNERLAMQFLNQQDQSLHELVIHNTKTDSENMFEKSTHFLFETMFKKEGAPEPLRGEVTQFFYRGHHGRHSERLGVSGVYGLAFTNSEDDLYGIAPNMDPNLHHQTYCMSNFASGKYCGSSEFVYMDNPELFAQKVFDLAVNKVALFDILGDAALLASQTTLKAASDAAILSTEGTMTDNLINPVTNSLPDPLVDDMRSVLEMDQIYSTPPIELVEQLEMKLDVNQKAMDANHDIVL